MTTVSGPLRIVSGDPSKIVQVRVFREDVTPDGGGLITTEVASSSVRAGQATFNCVPGPAVLRLVGGGRLTTVPLVVPDKPDATLEECIRAGELADTATRSELEELARRIVESVSQAERAAASAQESASAAADDAREVASAGEIIDSYRLQVTTAHGETLSARDGAVGAAETATRQAETATDRAGAAAESAANAGESETSAAVSAQTATQQADRATSEADRATSEADRAGQAAADSSVKAVSDRVNELLAGAPEAYDTLLEIAQELERGQSVEAALTREIAGKAPADHTHTAQDVGAAPASHTHTIAQVTGLDSALAGKVSSVDVSTNVDPVSIAKRTRRGTIFSADPTQAGELATKRYVDSKSSAHTHKVADITDLPALETPTREMRDRANKIAVRDGRGRLLSQNYKSAADVLATEAELPHTLASLWAARQVATDVANARTPKIVTVKSLPASPDPSTVYLVTG